MIGCLTILIGNGHFAANVFWLSIVSTAGKLHFTYNCEQPQRFSEFQTIPRKKFKYQFRETKQNGIKRTKNYDGQLTYHGCEVLQGTSGALLGVDIIQVLIRHGLWLDSLWLMTRGDWANLATRGLNGNQVRNGAGRFLLLLLRRRGWW